MKFGENGAPRKTRFNKRKILSPFCGRINYIQRMFDEIPAQNGKKAPAWVNIEILELTNV